MTSPKGIVPQRRSPEAAAFTAGLAAGDRLDSYETVGTLGHGGMGEVYRARDTRLGATWRHPNTSPEFRLNLLCCVRTE